MRRFTTHAVNTAQTPSGMTRKSGAAISQTASDRVEQGQLGTLRLLK